MFKIKPGKLYTPTTAFSVSIFNENDFIEASFHVSPGQSLLGLSGPFRRKRRISSPILGAPISSVEYIEGWSCKFLFEDKVVEFHAISNSRHKFEEYFMKLIEPLKKPGPNA